MAPVDPKLVLVDNFDGWGTSLCWWANLVGGFANRSAYTYLAFSQLKLNIVRYNIGGGENPSLTNTMEIRARMPGFQPSPGVWDWTADANQRWILHDAIARGANRVVAFANSPPWWMTVSGSATGSANATNNNLKTEYEPAFAGYLATVVSNLTALDQVRFDSISLMNEPSAAWWKYGGRQEGCYMDPPQQARMLNLLRTQLTTAAPDLALQGSEDYDEQSAIASINGYDAAARDSLRRLVSHTYSANNPLGLRDLAGSLKKPLWVSEYGDGDATGMKMARRIREDIAVMWAHAWIYWQVVDSASWGMIYNPLDGSGNTAYRLNRKFHVMRQFTEFIRPGARILGVGDSNSLAAYDATNHTLTIVTVNDTTNTFTVTYDLAGFQTLPPQAARYRTSPNENVASLDAAPIVNKRLASTAIPQSVTTHVLTNVSPAPPASSPTSWYPMEKTLQDASGNGHDGSPSGNPVYIAGKLGSGAIQFEGSSSYAVMPHVASNHFTISFWIKTTSTGGGPQWWAGKGLVDGEIAGNYNDFGVALVGNKAALGIGNPDLTIASTTPINDGLWHHVTATRDSVNGQMRIYVDGRLEAEAIGPLGVRDAPPQLRLGAIQAGWAGGFLAGALDDVQVFDRTFSPAEIPALMNHPPQILPVANVSIMAGRTLSLHFTGSDADQPAQALIWSLAAPPAGAVIQDATGDFTWRPAIAQSPTTNALAVILSDNGTPRLSVTQSVLIAVSTPPPPQLAAAPSLSGGIQVEVRGEVGPDYVIETSTNLADATNWKPVGTNFSPLLPFTWADAQAGGRRQRFFRARLGP